MKLALDSRRIKAHSYLYVQERRVISLVLSNFRSCAPEDLKHAIFYDSYHYSIFIKVKRLSSKSHIIAKS